MITEGELNLKRNILNLSPVLVNQISLAVRLLFIVFTIYFLGIKNNRPISKIQKSWEVAYLTLVIPLIFPHQHKHAFYMLFPAIVYLLYFLIFTYNNKYNVIGKVKWNIVLCLLIGSFILMTLTTDGVIGRYYNNITQHYKTVTYGAIFVAIALALSKPKYLVVNNKKDPRTVD